MAILFVGAGDGGTGGGGKTVECLSFTLSLLALFLLEGCADGGVEGRISDAPYGGSIEVAGVVAYKAGGTALVVAKTVNLE